MDPNENVIQRHFTRQVQNFYEEIEEFQKKYPDKKINIGKIKQKFILLLDETMQEHLFKADGKYRYIITSAYRQAEKEIKRFPE